MKRRIRLGLLGSRGRMGKTIQALLQTEEFLSRIELIAQADQGDSLEPLLKTDVILDFSTPLATRTLVDLTLTKKSRLPSFIIGTTGLDENARKVIKKLSRKTSVLVSSNFSLGVMVLKKILHKYAAELAGYGFAVSMVETHHRHKKDAPSGTALALKKEMGIENCPIESIRQGEVIGEHRVRFENLSEKLELIHEAKDRSLFARGALLMVLKNT